MSARNVSQSGRNKIARAIAAGWTKASRCGPGEYMRQRKAEKRRKVKP
jgi:hypothetical protein